MTKFKIVKTSVMSIPVEEGMTVKDLIEMMSEVAGNLASLDDDLKVVGGTSLQIQLSNSDEPVRVIPSSGQNVPQGPVEPYVEPRPAEVPITDPRHPEYRATTGTQPIDIPPQFAHLAPYEDDLTPSGQVHEINDQNMAAVNESLQERINRMRRENQPPAINQALLEPKFKRPNDSGVPYNN